MRTKRTKKPKSPTALVPTHTRLFADDVALLKQIAQERRTEWQVELRLLVHRALKNEKREVVLLKETT